MKIKHVIVQAGGRGSRMGYLTDNKPKCLISIDGKPILYHLINAFPKSKFYIVGDYKFGVLEAYLKTFKPAFDYAIIKSEGDGTCGGLEKARRLIPKNQPFAVVWSDLYFKDRMPDFGKENYIGLSDELSCRWSYRRKELEEVRSSRSGVIGVFVFGKPGLVPPIPKDGEFVRFIRDEKVKMSKFFVQNMNELGTYEKYMEVKAKQMHSRFFNSIASSGAKITKRAADPKFEHLIKDETNWYNFVSKRRYAHIPKIYAGRKGTIEMEKIRGVHPYDISNMKAKGKVLSRIIDSLDELHSIGGTQPSDGRVLFDVYYNKTVARMKRVAELLPNSSNTMFYTVNGKRVKNLIHPKHLGLIKSAATKLAGSSEDFSCIHGDPTFSNTLIRSGSGAVVFIDPRGYFGTKKIYGDTRYDYAKLYYSLFGNYDSFNNGEFRVAMDGNSVHLEIKSERWDSKENERLFVERTGSDLKEIKLIHALLWLSLAGWVNDVDSVLGAYFRGLELFYGAGR